MRGRAEGVGGVGSGGGGGRAPVAVVLRVGHVSPPSTRRGREGWTRRRRRGRARASRGRPPARRGARAIGSGAASGGRKGEWGAEGGGGGLRDKRGVRLPIMHSIMLSTLRAWETPSHARWTTPARPGTPEHGGASGRKNAAAKVPAPHAGGQPALCSTQPSEGGRHPLPIPPTAAKLRPPAIKRWRRLGGCLLWGGAGGARLRAPLRTQKRPSSSQVVFGFVVVRYQIDFAHIHPSCA